MIPITVVHSKKLIANRPPEERVHIIDKEIHEGNPEQKPSEYISSDKPSLLNKLKKNTTFKSSVKKLHGGLFKRRIIWRRGDIDQGSGKVHCAVGKPVYELDKKKLKLLVKTLSNRNKLRKRFQKSLFDNSVSYNKLSQISEGLSKKIDYLQIKFKFNKLMLNVENYLSETIPSLPYFDLQYLTRYSDFIKWHKVVQLEIEWCQYFMQDLGSKKGKRGARKEHIKLWEKMFKDGLKPKDVIKSETDYDYWGEDGFSDGAVNQCYRRWKNKNALK